MEALLSFILGTVLFFYLIGIVGKFLLRLFVARKMRQFSSNGTNGSFFGQGYNNQQSKQNNKNYKEGDVFISQVPTNQKKIKDKVGEYVDFEEVK